MTDGRSNRPKRSMKSSPCPVCGKPRGPGTDHGACMEIRAKTEGKKPSGFVGDNGHVFTEDEARQARHNKRSKQYISGKNLPPWMFY